ncbi:8880_t:CDS:10 [Ambispora gerdemannii]|uniref:8880_t:CDS:1 n=1 Tax=Ambispora gerdemannii TaxID=144530 RepID=A0A9N9BXP6_9GLOM|nr:8880_t:CDS:10 [Ambispora gerdemannii]
MLKQHYILQQRYYIQTFAIVVIAPIVVLLIVLGLETSTRNLIRQDINKYRDVLNNAAMLSNAELVVEDINKKLAIWDLPGLYQCEPPAREKTKCITLLYAPIDQRATKIMQNFVNKNQKRTGNKLDLSDRLLMDLNPPKHNLGIVPVSSSDFIYSYSLLNPKVVDFAVSFEFPDDGRVEYTLWYNFTTVQNKTIYGEETQINTNSRMIGLMKFSAHSNKILDIVIDHYGNNLLSIKRGIEEAILMSNGLPNAQIDIKLKEFPDMQMNIDDSNNTNNENGEFIDPDIFQSVGMFLVVPVLLLFIVAGVMETIREKEYGQRNWMEMMGLRPSVYWLSHFISAGYLVVFQSLILISLVLGAAFVLSLLAFIYLSIVVEFWAIWYISEKKIAKGDFSKPQGTSAGWIIGLFLPFFQFAELYSQIVLKSTKTPSYTDNPGFSWNELKSQTLYDIKEIEPFLPQPYYPLIIMSAQIIVYTMAVWIIDQVPKFYARNFGQSYQETSNDTQYVNLDEDLANERFRALDFNQPFALRIVKIVKEFRGNLFSKSREKKLAVNGLYLTAEDGQMFALLGQNGAGKTTTISIIAGHLQPTSGNASIYNKDIITSMDSIRRSLGFCPQHDLLYTDLTCEEHINLFAGIKGIELDVEELLGKVDLVKAKNFPSSKLSGGMKRRLSVIIASIGDPKILILDEPTTGMDPLNRRKMWSFLSEYKKNRIILFTTHSMEEADLLGDRIGIMAHGKLRAIGSSTHLKNKYGIGYRIQIQTDPANIESVQEWVSQLVPHAKLQNSDGGELIYQIPPTAMNDIGDFVNLLEENPNGVINGWGIMNTTLEDAFLRISKEEDDSNDDNYFTIST